MSYDVYLTIDTGNGPIEVASAGNYTANCAAMWDYALSETGCEVSLRELDGKQAREVVGMLALAVAHMSSPLNAPHYARMNPPNGWGKHRAATEYLREVWEKCKAHPLCTLEVST